MIILHKSQSIFGAFNVNTRSLPLNNHKIEDYAPRRIGLHLGTVDYDNTLAVVAGPSGRDDEEVRARIRAGHARSGRNGDGRWVIRKEIRQRHTLGS